MLMKKFDLRGRREQAEAPTKMTGTARAAAAAFRKVDQKAALSEYEQERRATKKKIARLRALRLEKEAVERGDAANAPAEKKPGAKS